MTLRPATFMERIPAPMLAAPMSKAQIVDWSLWSIEVKYDGHRMIISVDGTDVRLFARPRSDGRMIERTEKLAPALLANIAKLPNGIYDGELMAGDTGTDVTRKDLTNETMLVVFDWLKDNDSNINLMTHPYRERRQVLEEMFRRLGRNIDSNKVQLAESRQLRVQADVKRFVETVWQGGGEGSILKLNSSLYWPGKRDASMWVKIKRVESAALTIIGFEKSRGTVMGRGNFAIVKLRDDDGNETTCKTLNDEELKKFDDEFVTLLNRRKGQGAMVSEHPAIGRKLRIEFARRTRDGGYQGPVRWDRWENE